MNVTVLGSAGQIGGPLSRYLENNGHYVSKIDIQFAANHDLRKLSSDWTLAIANADFVFFLAYDVGGSKYLQKYENTQSFLDNNLMIMKNVFRVLHDCQAPFLFASSQMSSLSFSPYGTLKRIGEFYTRNLGGLICRFWNVFGPEDTEEKAHVITDFIRMSLMNQKITMRTDGEESRQFLSVNDCSSGLTTLMERYPQLDKERFYDVTSFEWTKIGDIAKIIASQTGSRVEYGSAQDSVQNAIRTEPTTHILDFWRPKLSLDQSISELVNHYRSKILAN